MSADHRPSHAREILNNPVFIDVVEDRKKSILGQIAYAAADEHDKRQALAAELRAVLNLFNTFQNIADEPTRPKRAGLT